MEEAKVLVSKEVESMLDKRIEKCSKEYREAAVEYLNDIDSLKYYGEGEGEIDYTAEAVLWDWRRDIGSDKPSTGLETLLEMSTELSSALLNINKMMEAVMWAQYHMDAKYDQVLAKEAEEKYARNAL